MTDPMGEWDDIDEALTPTDDGAEDEPDAPELYYGSVDEFVVTYLRHAASTAATTAGPPSGGATTKP